MRVCLRVPFALLALWSAGIAPLFGRELRRGPYLQVQRHDGMTIRWRTDDSVEGAAVVRFGPQPDRLENAVAARVDNRHFENAVEWVADVEGLRPDTKYFYSVEVDHVTLTGADERHYFRTAPKPGDQRRLRFLFLGDSGANRPRSLTLEEALALRGPISPIPVRNGWRRFNIQHAAELDGIILLGDNAYPVGSDVQWQTAFFQLYHDDLRTTPVWPCTGNHDMRNAMPFIFSVNSEGRAGGVPSHHALYYSADIGNVHIVVLDPWKQWLEVTQEPTHQPWQTQLNWLERDLAATRQDWILMVNHFPVYCDGNYDSDAQGVLGALRTALVPHCDKYGVDFFLAGHDHTYQRSYLVRGLTGTSDELSERHLISTSDGRAAPYIKSHGPDSGTIYIVSGTGGGSRPDGRFGHPAMVPLTGEGQRGLTSPGVLIMEFDGLSAKGWHVGTDGVALDAFQVVKQK